MPEGDVFDGFQLGSLPDGWERSETASGIPYYLNHNEGTTHWEHPEIAWVFKDIDGLNGIKYAAYRTAMKLRAIQKITRLNAVDMHTMQQAFEEMGLGQSQNNGVVTVAELEAILNKLFQLSQRDRSGFIETSKCTELAVNWILKCYDSGRTGVVKVRSMKEGLTAMCTASLQEKYTFIFRQVTGGHAGLSYSSLKTLLQDLLLLPQSVAESGPFPTDTVDDAVHSCWDTVGNQPTDILNMEEFLLWVLKEPRCLVWLPTLHRLATAETVKHEAKCSVCKAFPIIGFRYRCLKCSNVDLCQNCFWTQKTLKNHKITHPTREYCLATTTGDDVRDLAKQVKNKITRRYRHRPPKQSYLDYPTLAGRDTVGLPEESPVFANVHARVNLLASKLHELEGPAHVEGVQPEHQLPQQTVPQPVIVQPSEEERRQREQLEDRVHGLQEDKQLLEAQLEKLQEVLAQAPRERIVKVPVPVETTPRTTVVDLKTQAVNTLPFESSKLSETPQEWSLMLGGEEEEIAAMVRELMTAFPTQTTETIPHDLSSELFIAASAVGTALGSIVDQVASTQELS